MLKGADQDEARVLGELISEKQRIDEELAKLKDMNE